MSLGKLVKTELSVLIKAKYTLYLEQILQEIYGDEGESASWPNREQKQNDSAKKPGHHPSSLQKHSSCGAERSLS